MVAFAVCFASCDTRRDAEVTEDTVSLTLIEKFNKQYERLASSRYPATTVSLSGDPVGTVQVSDGVIYVSMRFKNPGTERYWNAHTISVDTSGKLIRYTEFLNWEKKTEGLHAKDRLYKEFPTKSPGAHYIPGDAETFFKRLVELMPKLEQEDVDG